VTINNLVFAFGGITILIASWTQCKLLTLLLLVLVNFRNNYSGDESYVWLIKPVVDVSKSYKFSLCHVCVQSL
jgi:hypothetical protein